MSNQPDTTPPIRPVPFRIVDGVPMSREEVQEYERKFVSTLLQDETFCQKMSAEFARLRAVDGRLVVSPA